MAGPGSAGLGQQSRGQQELCLETADQIRIPSPSLCSTTTYLKSCPQVQVGTGQILGLALLEEEKVLVSLEERRLVILDSTGKVAMP